MKNLKLSICITSKNYQTEDGQTQVDVRMENETVWLTQVQMEGNRSVTRNVPYFNLDMIISVGYRFNSKRGVKFRQWANRILKKRM